MWCLPEIAGILQKAGKAPSYFGCIVLVLKLVFLQATCAQRPEGHMPELEAECRMLRASAAAMAERTKELESALSSTRQLHAQSQVWVRKETKTH